LSLFSRTPALDGNDADASRARILAHFHQTFDRYEQLFEVLACDEAYFKKPIALRHPLIFYFGHTATFFINKLLLVGLVTERINPRFESMFAIGVDEMSWDDLNDANYDWPTVAEVKAYRDQVRAAVDRIIRTKTLALPIDWNNPWWAIVMGIEHERIHLETSSVLIRQHQLDYVKPHPAWAPCRLSGAAPENSLVEIPAGEVRLGKPLSDAHYGWDNEYGQHQSAIPAFQASRHLVSNGEFLSFVEAGGYDDDSLWPAEGLAWKTYAKASHPSFWLTDGTNWRLRLMTEVVDMPWDWPVETNYHEAKAFCAWKAAATAKPVRLPSEDEWFRLYDVAGVSEVADDQRAAANMHLDHWASSCPVDAFAHGDLFDVVGNVWQWTETPIYPFEGFDVHPIYDDFTTPTFDRPPQPVQRRLVDFLRQRGNGTHRATPSAATSSSMRGFRYVVGQRSPAQAACLLRKRPPALRIRRIPLRRRILRRPQLPPRTGADSPSNAMGERPARSALDLGCATGRATFELAHHFEPRHRRRFLGPLHRRSACSLAEQGDAALHADRTKANSSRTRTRRLADMGLDDGQPQGRVHAGRRLQPQTDAHRLRPDARRQPDRPPARARRQLTQVGP
jgi:5-histidylcysteine sulfoxide synthase